MNNTPFIFFLMDLQTSKGLIREVWSTDDLLPSSTTREGPENPREHSTVNQASLRSRASLVNHSIGVGILLLPAKALRAKTGQGHRAWGARRPGRGLQEGTQYLVLLRTGQRAGFHTEKIQITVIKITENIQKLFFSLKKFLTL